MPRSRINTFAAIVGPAVILVLLVIRVPSIVEPAGGDEGLYSYIGQRINAGAVPFRDAFDQKPPAIHFAYASMWRMWPHESVVAIADLVVAALVAWLLVVLGRRLFSREAGLLAACVFLLFGNPAFQRLGGMQVRSQCETFIALAVTCALVVATASRTRWHLVAAGVWLALAFWLKYNAAVYAIPVVFAAQIARGDEPLRWRSLIAGTLTIGAGFVALSATILIYFAAHGALKDLWLATIDYNIRYSAETYTGIASMLTYPARLVCDRVHDEGLWFFGIVGTLLLTWRFRARSVHVSWLWLAAAVLSIGVNGARDLPQYFVQANPALALAAGAGLMGLRGRARWLHIATAAVLLFGCWRVGAERTSWTMPRVFGIPEAWESVRGDIDDLRGQTPRDAYLARFGGQGTHDKFSALAVETLASRIRAETTSSDSVLVFGFSGGSVLAKSERRSASRFFWSRPVVIEFASNYPGYGSAGLLADLERDPPALVALQRQDWGILAQVKNDGRAADPNSYDFFMTNPSLRSWLDAGYVHDESTPEFDIWRRRSS